MISPSKNLSKFTKKELDNFFGAATCRRKNQAFTFLVAPAILSFGRVLVIASRKYGNSPERNLLKRRCKAIYWEAKLYEKNTDLIIIARRAGQDYDFATLQKTLLSLFN